MIVITDDVLVPVTHSTSAASGNEDGVPVGSPGSEKRGIGPRGPAPEEISDDLFDSLLFHKAPAVHRRFRCSD